MSSTLIEQSRALHEDLEILETAMYRELGEASSSKLTRPDEIARDQVVSTLLNKHQAQSSRLTSLHKDADGARADEIATISGQSTMFSSFYDQLKSIREYHRKFPGEPVSQTNEETLLAEVLEGTAEEGFTGEEAEGRYVDMHSLHEMYLNLKGVERIDYINYLNTCGDLSSVPRATTKTAAYGRYLRALKEYMLHFLRRTQPLVPLSKLLEAAEADFSERWEKGEVARWQQQQQQQAGGGVANGGGASGAGTAGACTECSSSAGAVAPIDLTQYATAKDLEALGLEVLKMQLSSAGLKAGGSLTQRAERLFLLKSAPIDLIPKKELAKPVGAAPNGANGANGSSVRASAGGGSAEASGASERGLALSEEHVSRLGELLAETLQETKAFVEKKQARTYDEIERDLAAHADEEMAEEEEEEEEAEKPIYNPLNLPLGWDGKPIPYWLYKLHGLNLEFKCEICGNYSYWGPRPFERHFQEWRHSYGMKCLGIPNTKPFHGITLIEDAYTLWAKLKGEQGATQFNPDFDEEFEDSTGNVMNRKVYTDLARQGLLD